MSDEISEYRETYRERLAAGQALADQPAPDPDITGSLVPYMGAQVGWSPARESGCGGEVGVIAPDGLPAIVEGVCSECLNGLAGDPIFGKRVCLGCLHSRRDGEIAAKRMMEG